MDIVLAAPGGLPLMKVSTDGGVLGDVDNNGQVDFFDMLLVALYSYNVSLVLPNNGHILLGDVNADGRVDLTDAYVLATYLNNPSDSSLPSGIGQAVRPSGDDTVHAGVSQTFSLPGVRRWILFGSLRGCFRWVRLIRKGVVGRMKGRFMRWRLAKGFIWVRMRLLRISG